MKAILRMLAFAFVLGAISFSAVAGDKASFGFKTDGKTSGFFLNPTLESVWIIEVNPDSPVEKAGLLVGDVLVSANNKPIAGESAKSMLSLMRSFEPGDRLQLKVLRSGKEVLVDIVAGTR